MDLNAQSSELLRLNQSLDEAPVVGVLSNGSNKDQNLEFVACCAAHNFQSVNKLIGAGNILIKIT